MQPDFAAQEDELIAATVAAIRSFPSSDDLTFRQFAFDCNPDYGQIYFCFDTEANSRRFSEEHGRDLVARRSQRVDYTNHLAYAINAIEYPFMPMVPYRQ